MGTPDFAVPSLEFLINSSYNLLCVITQPDRMKGRGRKRMPPPVKIAALKANIKVVQPEKINDEKVINTLRELAPDIIIVAAYGQILSDNVLAIPKEGCINVHASILPQYRGAAPIQWAIINGEKETGITTMLMDQGMDTGDILLQEKIEILSDETAGSLHDKLSILGAHTLEQTLEQLELGVLKAKEQDHTKATYAPMLKKDDGLIKWNTEAENIYNLIRGTNPWPGSYTFLDGRQLKIHEAKVYESSVCKGKPGQVLGLEKDKGILVSCKKGVILLSIVQPPGKREMNAWDYVLGYPVKIGSIFS